MATAGSEFVATTNQRLANAEAAFTTVNQRIATLEAAIQNMIMPDDGRANRNLPESILAIETGCNKYLSKEYMDPYIDSKIKTAFELAVLTQNQTSGSSGNKDNQPGLRKFPILECKSMANVGTLSDAKTYRSFNRKMKNAMDQVRPASREVLEILDLIKEDAVTTQMKTRPREKMRDVIIDLFSDKYFDKFPKLKEEDFMEINRDLWSLYTDRVEDKSEAAIKMKAVSQGEGLWIYIRLHQWFN